ncbi:MAG: MATE family efflux transporter [Fusobacteriaceae bacterium]
MKNNELKTDRTLLDEPIIKLLVKYSVPAIIGMLVSALYNVVDRMFIGNIPEVGAIAITGIGVTMPFVTILLAFGMLLGVGAAANISIKLGQGKKYEAEKIIGNLLLLSAVIGGIIAVVGLIFSQEILLAFGASSESLSYAKKYMDIILAGSIFNIAGFALGNTLRSDGSPKISAAIMVVSCMLNIILDPIFIFKLNMGIEGAAYATILSQILTFVLTIGYYLSRYSNLKLKKENFFWNTEISKIILIIGLPPFVMQLVNSLIQIINNNILKAYGGDFAIGAMATVNGIGMLCLMPIFGIAQGSQPIIGYNYGAKNYLRVKETVYKSGIFAFLLLVIPYFIVQFFPDSVIKTFNSDPAIVRIAVRGLKIYTLCFPVIAIGMVGSQFFQAIAKPKTALFLSLARQALILIPVTFVLTPMIKLDGVWVAQPVSDFLSALLAAYFVIKEFKKFDTVQKDEETEDKISENLVEERCI